MVKTSKKINIPKKWIAMELEHTKSKSKAKKIVLDHIGEYGNEYYPALAKMTAKLKKRK